MKLKVFNLSEAIMKKYPDAVPERDFLVEYDPFTETSEVKYWNLPYPQLEEEEALVLEFEAVLDRVKDAKKQELNVICNQEITKGFLYTVNGVEYRFSYDMEAQMNFAEARAAMADGLIEEVEWTCYIASTGERKRIMLNADDMAGTRLAQLTQKNAIIAKYNNILLTKVYPETNIEIINAIKWE